MPVFCLIHALLWRSETVLIVHRLRQRYHHRKPIRLSAIAFNTTGKYMMT